MFVSTIIRVNVAYGTCIYRILWSFYSMKFSKLAQITGQVSTIRLKNNCKYIIILQENLARLVKKSPQIKSTLNKR